MKKIFFAISFLSDLTYMLITFFIFTLKDYFACQCINELFMSMDKLFMSM